MLLLIACATGPTSEDSPAETADTGPTTTTTPAPTVCDDGLPARPWQDGGDGDGYGSLAGDVTIPTTTGEWNLREHWTGCDSYVFLGIDDNDGVTSMLLDSKIKKLFTEGPQNAHYFLIPAAMGDALEAELADIVDAGLNDETSPWWADRVHLVTSRPGSIEGWLGDVLVAGTWNLAGVDRMQTVRELGYLADATTGWESAEWRLAGYEVDLYNFEAAREFALDAQGATVIPVLDDALVSDGSWAGVTTKAEVELPDAATMAGFDSFQIDMTLDCGGNYLEACPAWDYLNYAYLCPNDDAGTTDVDESASGCVEINRTITPYWRGGRWVMDASAWLAELKDGGLHTFRFYSAQTYYFDVSFRFFDAGSGTRPQSMEALWTGGGFDESYQDNHPPITFTPPEGTTRVKLMTVITGHGFGSDRENCAEFCNHGHEFTVNGGTPHLEDFPMAGSEEGCAEQVATKGVFPNQAGTWPYGRGGWCPGLGVDPWVVDITDDVDLSGENTISYRILLDGEEEVPTVINYDFSARIDMISYLVYER